MKWKWNLPVYYFCFVIVFNLLSSNYISGLDSYTLVSNTMSYIMTFHKVVPIILVIVIIVFELIKKKRDFANLINLALFNFVALYAVSVFWGLFTPYR
ncbi:hypothetical protein CI105_04665 [Candidatus Izimaplasma bacterium ZiA1]|uniref:hypothetical protein n=1 Tax=Candidatus Izimoplasma sp. ZiA1 TaxID=2024899 RepID=UPI000BAA4727|nr:hypothetical protein CI105_04665 [Candidatus Izimaplasma bacterium ZiA1]